MNQHTDVSQSSLSSKQQHGPLEWVGMENIRIPLQGLVAHPVEAKLSSFVSLSKKDQRGIHMSRIYQIVQDLSAQPLSREVLSATLQQMVTSQNGSSSGAKLKISSSPLFHRKALKSEKTGFKSYPLQITATLKENVESVKVAVMVEYSSTCPCSAALSREVISEEFAEHFSKRPLSLESAREFLLDEKTWPAWPHAQRSRAYGHFVLNASDRLPDFSHLINKMEEALATPTQTAVKRVDEQEFARLNAKNLMFCEDAARRLKSAFQNSSFKDFRFIVRHLESLHSHDVRAESRKN
jgi:GTP cyclohydrolase I